MAELVRQLLANEAHVPGLGSVSRDPLLAVGIAEGEAVLGRVLGEPVARRRRRQAEVDGGTELVLAVSRPRGAPDLLGLAKHLHLIVIRAIGRFDSDLVSRRVRGSHERTKWLLDRAIDEMASR